MKKNVGKKIRLMALLASLTLVLWGGVTACSNGSDDDGGATIKLKGAFFEEGDDKTPWVYCNEELKETTESGIWEGEITSVNSNGWDKFGLEINDTWYGAEDGITEIKDAKLVKDSDKNFWLATAKGGKTKVTVNLNKMTITAVDASQITDTPDDDEAIEFSFNYKASDISKAATSIKITVTNITSTTNDEWKFWAATSDSDSDEIKYKSGEETACIYELEITDTTKIAYVKEKGIAIKGAKGLSATVTVTTTEPTTTTPPTADNGDDDTTSPGKEDDETPSDDDNKGTEEPKEFTFSYESSEISETTASITITVTGITGTTSGDWWFWAKTDSGDGDKIVWKSGSGTDTIYEVTITDATKIAYIKENGLAIKGAAGLTANVTVTQSDTPSTAGDGTGGDKATGGDVDQPPTLPSWVGIEGNFLMDKDGKFEYTALKETSIKGIWIATIENVSYQWPNFYIKAGDDEATIIYAGEGGSNGTNVTVNGETITLVETSSWDKLHTTSWSEDGTTSVNLKVTVDFTGIAPTIKIETVE